MASGSLAVPGRGAVLPTMNTRSALPTMVSSTALRRTAGPWVSLGRRPCHVSESRRASSPAATAGMPGPGSATSLRIRRPRPGRTFHAASSATGNLRKAENTAMLSVSARATDDADVGRVTRERQQLFDDIAPQYDLLNDALSLGLHRVWKRMTVSWSGAERGDSALDICCGSGDIALLLSERVGPTGQVVGLDFAPEQLEVARRKEQQSPRMGCCPVDWVWGDALALPFEAESFDAVTVGYGLRNVADISLALGEIWRVLRPGKSCAILDFNNSEDALVSGFQSFMLNNAVVPVATQFGLASQYEYLEPSIRRFPHGRAQEALAKEAGFTKAIHYETGFGLMGVLIAKK